MIRFRDSSMTSSGVEYIWTFAMKIATGLQLCVCGARDCRVEIQSELTRTYKQFLSPYQV